MAVVSSLRKDSNLNQAEERPRGISRKDISNQTRRPLCTGIFSAKNVTHQHGFEPTKLCLPGRRTTNCVMVKEFTKWSNKIKIWQNLEKNLTQIMIFLLAYMWVENIKHFGNEDLVNSTVSDFKISENRQ